MIYLPRLLTSAAIVATTCAITAAAYYYRRRKLSNVNEVMIFCKLQYNGYNYFDKLISFIEKAKHSVSVCMPSIHNPAIQGRLVRLIQTKNIKVRIIIDGDGYNESTESSLKELAIAGAEIKWKQSRHRMQHKFCLIDDETLMTGTLDWGNDLSFDNWNYVYITNHKELVEPVKTGFNSLWETCQNSVEDLINSNSDEDSERLLQDLLSEDYEDFEILSQENVSDLFPRSDSPVTPTARAKSLVTDRSTPSTPEVLRNN